MENVTTPMPRRRRWLTGVSWFMIVGLFVFAPLKFLPGNALGFDYAERFVSWGYPWWARYVVGAVEILIAFLLLLPRQRFLGAALFMFLLTGAVTTHIVNHHPLAESAAALINLPLATIVALAIWPADWRIPFTRAEPRTRPAVATDQVLEHYR
jgi:uncharacterized membrane protein YphA (DoxX/SURF4 family)